MKPINAEEIVRVFNGWLEEADSLAEREAIECCMSKETRFCPFMRKLTREHWRTAQDRVAESYKDRFGKCIGEKCMAYENGRCKRLEREGAQ